MCRWRSVLSVMVVLSIVAFVAGACGNDDDQGTVSVSVSDFAGETGSELAGVLLSDVARGGTAFAGFAVVVDDDPFSHVEAMGNVSEEWDLDDSGLWPWPTGEASVPAGTYTLRVAIGNDYCCYSSWMPAATPGLRLCDVPVEITGDDQTIEITDIPEANGDGLPMCGVR